MRLPTVLLGLGLALLSTPALAHDHSTETHSEAADESSTASLRRPAFGGLGFMQVGTFIGPIGDVAPELGDPLALGAGASSPAFGYTIGGGGRTLLWERLVVGGKGYGLFAPSVGGPNGEATIRGGGGGLEIGVAAVNRSKWLFVPFVGLGGMGLGMRVSNTSDSSIRFGDGDPIGPGMRRDYAGGFAYGEVGAGTHRLLFFGQTGGLAVGFDVGALLSFDAQGWSDDGRTLSGVGAPELSGVYARLTLGGGGFSYR